MRCSADAVGLCVRAALADVGVERDGRRGVERRADDAVALGGSQQALYRLLLAEKYPPTAPRIPLKMTVTRP